MLYFWILTVILFALPVGLVMLTWDRSQADARECVIRWQIIEWKIYKKQSWIQNTKRNCCVNMG